MTKHLSLEEKLNVIIRQNKILISLLGDKGIKASKEDKIQKAMKKSISKIKAS